MPCSNCLNTGYIIIDCVYENQHGTCEDGGIKVPCQDCTTNGEPLATNCCEGTRFQYGECPRCGGWGEVPTFCSCPVGQSALALATRASSRWGRLTVALCSYPRLMEAWKLAWNCALTIGIWVLDFGRLRSLVCVMASENGVSFTYATSTSTNMCIPSIGKLIVLWLIGMIIFDCMTLWKVLGEQISLQEIWMRYPNHQHAPLFQRVCLWVFWMIMTITSKWLSLII